MQISAISNQGFTGRRTNIDNVIAQDDSVLREVAVNAALQHSDEKKHKKINNALWYSVPVVAGLAAGILNKGQSTLFHKTITGTAAKLASGLKHAAGWGIALGAADAIVGGKNLLTKHSEEAREFEKKHPFAMFAGLLGTGLAVLAVLPKGISKLYSKISPKVIGNLAAKTRKIADSINNNNFVKKANKFFGNIGKKVPSVAKEAGKTALSWAPDALLIGTLIHSLNHGFSVGREANENYNYLKDKQMDLAKARINELKMENDFLRQFPENEEHLKLRKRPLADLPEEIQEKLAEIQNESQATEEIIEE